MSLDKKHTPIPSRMYFFQEKEESARTIEFNRQVKNRRRLILYILNNLTAWSRHTKEGVTGDTNMKSQEVGYMMYVSCAEKAPKHLFSNQIVFMFERSTLFWIIKHFL